jgi:hypothetical protein
LATVDIDSQPLTPDTREPETSTTATDWDTRKSKVNTRQLTTDNHIKQLPPTDTPKKQHQQPTTNINSRQPTPTADNQHQQPTTNTNSRNQQSRTNKKK